MFTQNEPDINEILSLFYVKMIAGQCASKPNIGTKTNDRQCFLMSTETLNPKT